MKRSVTFLPAAVSRLETRLVLSHLHPSVAAAAKGHHKPAHAHVATTPAVLVQGVTQQTFSTGLVVTTHRTLSTSGNGQAIGQDIITNSDGTSEVDTAQGTLSNGTTTTRISKVFSNGTTQNEVATDTNSTSFGTLQADGTIIPGSTKSGQVVTTNFTHITTQAGLGTQTIVGSSVEGQVNGQLETITNQQVTNFNGTVDQVHIVSTQTANPAVEDVSKTVIAADGTSTTTTSTIKTLSASII